MNQILISLGILALWALTSLLCRDAQPLPPRPTRARRDEADGRSQPLSRPDRPGASQSHRAIDRMVDETTDARLASRSAERPLALRYGASGERSSSDDIRILESSPRAARPLGGSP